MRSWWCLACLGGILTGSAGCGPSTVSIESEKVQPAAAGDSATKTALEEIAKTGELGSGVMDLQEQLEQMKSTDEAKATELLKDLEALQKLASPEQIKQKAKQMAGKL